MGDFLMPALGADMESGTLVEWKVKVGDRVKRGDLIAVVETVKGAIDVEVFEDGTVSELVAQPGTEVPVGGVLARIEGAPAAAKAPAPAAVSPPPPVSTSGPPGAPEPVTSPPPAVAHEGERPRLSPRQRKLAAERVGGGPQRTMREVIAAAMARSKREIPHYYLDTHVDAGAAMAWLDAENIRRPVAQRLLPAALLLKASALAVREVPELNGMYVNGAFAQASHVHLGVAISVKGGGVVAPAIHDADTLPVGELMVKLLDLVARTRGGGLRSSELSDGTVTVTNLGDLGVETVHAVIYPPQVAIIGFGKIVERPWVRAGRVEPRPVVCASLSADHRASDGHRGALFLTVLDRLLQTPEKL